MTWSRSNHGGKAIGTVIFLAVLAAAVAGAAAGGAMGGGLIVLAIFRGIRDFF